MENEVKNKDANDQNQQSSDKKTRAKKGLGKKIKTIIAFALCVVLAFFGGYFSRYVFDSKELNKTHDIVRIIEKFGYVLDENGNPRELTETDYAKALANGLLDQYSEYYTKQEYDKLTSQKSGNHTGFGVTIYGLEDFEPIFVSVIGNSPADKSHVKAGDKVLSATIDGEEPVHFTNSKELNDFLSNCPSDKKVTFNILRGTQNRTIEMQKAFYKASYTTYYDSDRKMSIDASLSGLPYVEDTAEKMNLPSDTALIKLEKFEGDVASQLRATLSYMEEKGRTKLILDLRDNGGGYMTALCDVAEQLIYNEGNKTLIAYASGKTDNESFYMTSNKDNSFITNIVVLANDGTASASECLIGAMLNYGERFSLDNLVVEKNDEGVAKTYGKGIMQTTYLLLDGSALKLTTARIFWPDKTTCIHSKGILPNPENATEKGQSAIDRAVSILQD